MLFIYILTRVNFHGAYFVITLGVYTHEREIFVYLYLQRRTGRDPDYVSSYCAGTRDIFSILVAR